jgi:hypothetical protein
MGNVIYIDVYVLKKYVMCNVTVFFQISCSLIFK